MSDPHELQPAEGDPHDAGPLSLPIPRVGATRVPRRIIGICAGSFFVSSVWSLLPPGAPLIAAPALRDPTPVLQSAAALAFNLDAFRAPVWVAEAPPPATPTEAPPPAPLRMQLLAIFREGGAYKAAIYDADADRLWVLAEGEAIGGRTVETIDATTLSLRDGESTRRLSLRGGGSGPP